MFCLNISGKWVPLYHMYSVYPGEDKGCERVDNVIIVNYVGSGVHGLVNSLLCFSQERYLRPITYSVFQWADPTPSCHTKHRPTNPQTIKFLSHFWVFGVFWQSFKKACSSQNLWENIKEKIIIGTSVVNIVGLFCWTCNPLALGDWLRIWWQLVMNIVLSWPTTHRNRCFLVSALTNPLRVN